MSRKAAQPPQPEAPVAHEAILASAGSGKTFELAHRYIGLLARGVPPERIIALTFSRKAGGEIFDSVVRYLCEACADDARAAAAAQHARCPALTAADFLRLLRAFLDQVHRLHIGTLDSFIVGVVRAFPTELGISPGFDVTDEESVSSLAMRQEILEQLYGACEVDRDAQREFFEAFKLMTYGREEKDVDASLNAVIAGYRDRFRLLPDPEAWGRARAVWPRGSPWLKPGDDGPPDEAALQALVDSPALPAPMRGSFGKVIAFARAYDAYARWDGSLDDNRVFRQLLEQAESLRSGEAVLQYRGKDYPLGEEPGRALWALLRRVVRAEIEKCLQQTQGIGRLLGRYEAAYDAFVRQAGLLTFADVQYLLTEGNPRSGGAVISREAGRERRLYVDYRLDSRLDHWLLDEFQDTSDLQWAVLSNLADEILQDDSGQRSFFFVGDVKQAIYGWRGGNPRLFGRILATYGERIRTRPLSTSQRSGPAVVAAVNRVFDRLESSGLPERAAAAWRVIWQEHRCAPRNAGLEGCALLVEPRPAPDAPKPTAADRHAVVSDLLREIDPVRRGLSAAILVRQNEEGRQIVDYLRAHCPGIPIAHEGRGTLLDNPVVRLLLALARFAAHPGDTLAWRHLQMSPLAADLARSPAGPDALPAELLRGIHDRGFRGFLLDWGRRLDAAAPLDAFGRRRWEDLTRVAAEFDRSGSRDATAFVRHAESYQSFELAGVDAVRVMTVHQAKGLGFDVVILPELMGRSLDAPEAPDLVMGAPPGDERPRWALRLPRRVIAECDPVLREALAAADDSAVFEQLCVLYVALTRAKRGLYIVTSFPGKSSEALTPAALLKRQLAAGAAPRPLELNGRAVDCLYAEGAPDWHTRVPRRAEKPPAPAPAAEGFAARPSHRAPLRPVEPSSQEASVRPAGWLFNAEASLVLDFGRAMHELLEQVEWIEDCDPEAIARAWLAASADTDEVKRDVCEQFRRALAAPEVRRALARPAGPVELWREKRFELVQNERLVSGAFDRVTIHRDRSGAAARADVVDYKSDRVNGPADIRRAIETYRPQLDLYAEALSQILHLPRQRVTGHILFTRAGQLCAVDGGA